MQKYRRNPYTVTYTEWPVFNITRPTSTNFSAEGADFSDEANPQPTRSSNFTAIISRAVRVSGTQRAVDTATHEDPMTFQKKNALRKLKADMEFALMNGGAKVSGASGTARQLAKLLQLLLKMLQWKYDMRPMWQTAN